MIRFIPQAGSQLMLRQHYKRHPKIKSLIHFTIFRISQLVIAAQSSVSQTEVQTGLHKEELQTI